MSGRCSSVRPATMAVVGIAALLSGCAELQVQVDIINPSYVVDEMEYFRLERAFTRIRGSDPSDIDAQVDALQQRHQDAMLELASIYDVDAAAAQNPAVRSTFVDTAQGLRSTVQSGGVTYNEFQQFKSDLRRLDDEIQQKALEPEAYSGQGRLATALQNLVMQRLRRDKNFRADRLAEIRYNAEQTNTPAATERRAPIVNAAIALRSAIGGGSLVRSDHAFFVANAPPNAWKEEFNRAFGSGKFGNSDIAIKLGTDGDFSVKGLTFDPSTVAAVAAKVTTQALLVAAQISRVPVQTKSLASGSPTPGFLDTGDAMAETERTLAARQASLDNQRKAIEGLALAVLHEEQAIKDKASRAAALTAIRASFDALRPSLSLTDYQ